MAAPTKRGLEYFSLDVDLREDRKIKYMRRKYKALGSDIYIELLQIIYKEMGYYAEWDQARQEDFALDYGISMDELRQVVEDMFICKLFSREMFESHKILTSAGIQKRYLKGVARRKTVRLKRDFVLIDLVEFQNTEKDFKVQIIIDDINPVNVNNNPVNVNNNPVNDGNNPQRKVKESKEKERKEESASALETPSLFEEFWTAYPNKRSRDRAENEWLNQRIDEELFQVVMDALEMHKKSRQWKDSAFIPFAHNWLRQRRYYDEVEPEAKAEEEFRYDNPINPCHIIDLESY